MSRSDESVRGCCLVIWNSAVVPFASSVLPRTPGSTLHGEMLPPPKVDAPTAELEMSRLSIYATQRGGVREFQKRLPLVWAAAWRSLDQRVALAVTALVRR